MGSIVRVLVVEDDCLDLRGEHDALVGAGFDVAIAEDGHTALRAMKDHDFDVVLADLRLPDMSALDLFERTGAYASRRVPPFVVITAFGSIQEAVDAMKLGVADFLQKPMPSHDLIAILRQAATQSHTVRLTAEQIESTNITDSRVYAALAAIRQRFGDPSLRCGAIAAELGISGYYLARLLKIETGKTFLHHLHRQRVAEAERLLCTTSLSIKEIAFQVGFASNTARLDAYFRRFHRTTPTNFREEHRNPLANEPWTL
jgi:YesN/AraC family two-component response regulator